MVGHVALTVGLGLLTCVTLSAQTPARSSTASTASSASSGATAKAALVDKDGRGLGEARFRQTPHGVLLTLELRDATPGVHALHIHQVGRCDAPTFDSAGGHFSPSGRQHGYLAATGPHAGDLPNIDVPGTKQLTVEHLVGDVTLDPGPRSLLDPDGSAIVIHAGKDDYATDPAGSAGPRIACGPIIR